MINEFKEVKKLLETNFDETMNKFSIINNSILFNLNEKKEDVWLMMEDNTSNVVKSKRENASRIQSNFEILESKFAQLGKRTNHNISCLFQNMHKGIELMETIKSDFNR
jgi:hypothetical protein